MSQIKESCQRLFNIKDEIDINEELHFPINDFHDLKTGAQAFFHRHDSKEIGISQHFHFFRNWIPNIEELDGKIMTTHIAALQVSESFEPISWFTVNQWVTGNYFLLLEDLNYLCEDYNFNSIKNNDNSIILSWLEDCFNLGKKNYFNNLICNRDIKLKELFKQNNSNILENNNFEILSRIYVK